MKDEHALRATVLGLVGAAAILALASVPAHAVDFQKGELQGSWDTTLSWGAQFRLDDPDQRLIGLANGGSAYSVNGDDGNLNYGTGIFSNVVKLTTELELRYKNFGTFVRFRGFFDEEAGRVDPAANPFVPEKC